MFNISNDAHLVIRHVIVSPSILKIQLTILLSQSASFLLNEQLVDYPKLKANEVWDPFLDADILKYLFSVNRRFQ